MYVTCVRRGGEYGWLLSHISAFITRAVEGACAIALSAAIKNNWPISHRTAKLPVAGLKRAESWNTLKFIAKCIVEIRFWCGGKTFSKLDMSVNSDDAASACRFAKLTKAGVDSGEGKSSFYLLKLSTHIRCSVAHFSSALGSITFWSCLRCRFGSVGFSGDGSLFTLSDRWAEHSM